MDPCIERVRRPDARVARVVGQPEVEVRTEPRANEPDADESLTMYIPLWLLIPLGCLVLWALSTAAEAEENQSDSGYESGEDWSESEYIPDEDYDPE